MKAARLVTAVGLGVLIGGLVSALLGDVGAVDAFFWGLGCGLTGGGAYVAGRLP